MTEYADRIPAPRRDPGTRHRLDDARSHALEVERDDLRIQTGRLEADNRAMMRDRDQALAERDRAREVAREGYAEVGRLRAELGAAQELVAVLDDVTEQLDRARARYATRQEGQHFDPNDCAFCVAPALDRLPNGADAGCPLHGRARVEEPGLGSPSPRAQDQPGRRSETGCMGDPDTELRLAGVHPDQEAARRQSDARRLLDHAILAALPLAGGRVRKLLKALRHELVRVDAKRAEREG